MASGKISVLVVDDSTFMRRALRRMLESDDTIEVVGEAVDGAHAVELATQLRPDAITLDVRMPRMNGIEALRRIMAECPTPVLMVSAITTEGGATTLNALEAGAVDFIDKSSCHTMLDVAELTESLVSKIKMLAGVDVAKLPAAERAAPSTTSHPPSPQPAGRQARPSHIVVIGASTGGPIVLRQLLEAIPASYPGAFLVVQHMPPGFTSSFAERLDDSCALHVKEADEDDPVLPGHVLVAPSGYHLRLREVSESYSVVLSRERLDTPHQPSVDVLMESVARVWPHPLLGVLLSGMGKDGAAGARALKDRGGTVLVQDEQSSVVFGMPKAALQTGCVDEVLPVEALARAVVRFSLRLGS